jgi:predicted nucleotidyltransferase
MGINDGKPGLGEVLFSKTRRQVLRLLFGQPGRAYHLNEIVRLADVGTGSVARELEKLTAVGLVQVEKVGNQKHYEANRASPIYPEIHGIVLKTFGLADVLKAALATLQDRIRVAFVYGSVASNTDTAESDIDLLIIGADLSYPELMNVLAGAEETLARRINPTLYSSGEFARKLGEDSAFLQRVLKQPKIFLVGDKDDVPKSGEPGTSEGAET